MTKNTREIIKVGILDDNSSKVTEIMTLLKYGMKKASIEKRNKYAKYILKPYEIIVQANIEDIIEEVIKKEIDCILVDYKLSSYATVNFTGVEFAKKLEEVLYNFPIFILTAYEDDLFDKEIYNAYQIFNYDRYLKEEAENIELNFKIIEQVLKRNREIKQWEKEIEILLPKAGLTAKIDAQLLELDSKIEKSINAKSAIPLKIKEDLSSNKIGKLLEKIDEILDKE